MNKPEISIIMPGIRNHKWEDVYDSIYESTKRSFELIICGPYPLSQRLQKAKNVKYIKDWGSAVRASNLASLLCEGNLVTWTADDALFFKDSLDKNIDILYSMKYDPKNVVLCKYFEGEDLTNNSPLTKDSYYRINNSNNGSPFFNNEWYIFNSAIFYREFYEFLGGLDSTFEATAIADNDLAVRAQFMGAITNMTDIPLYKCEHMVGATGDHAPIFHCQHQHDEPIFHQRYRNQNWFTNNQRLDLLSDWKKAPIVWKTRFQD